MCRRPGDPLGILRQRMRAEIEAEHFLLERQLLAVRIVGRLGQADRHRGGRLGGAVVAEEVLLPALAIAMPREGGLDGPLDGQHMLRAIGAEAVERAGLDQDLEHAAGQQLGIDDITADGLPDLAHGFADRVEECTAGVFHQVPAVGDLVRIRQSSSDRLAVTTTTISGND